MTSYAANIIRDIKSAHEKLYTESLALRAGNRDAIESIGRFTDDVHRLRRYMDEIAPDVRLLDDYIWLINANLQWQEIATLLDVDWRIRIPRPPDNLWAPTQRLEKKDIDRWLSSLANHLSKMRHTMDGVKASRVEEIDEYNAKVYLCRDILGGAGVSPREALDFVEKVPPEAYSYLEDVWFHDVVRLQAYLMWELMGAIQDLPAGPLQVHFLDACDIYRHLLYDQDIKREPEMFFSIQDYLAEKYLDGEQRLRPDARDGLIRAKAEKIARARLADDLTIWMEAAAYVADFYNNIIAAIMEPHSESVSYVRRAILRSEGKDSRTSIMNVFEAAICMYFLKGLEYPADDWKS
ncbi:MAG: hypothetical protein U1E38_08520 [Rhodospirillales bacterium]